MMTMIVGWWLMYFHRPIFLDPINLNTKRPLTHGDWSLVALQRCQGGTFLAAIYSWAFTAVWHVYLLYIYCKDHIIYRSCMYMRMCINMYIVYIIYMCVHTTWNYSFSRILLQGQFWCPANQYGNRSFLPSRRTSIYDNWNLSLYA